MEQKTGEKSHKQSETNEELSDEQLKSAQKVGETATENTAEVQDILDEIDEVLEVNAEEFVKSFIQKGGQ